ncbi:M56 family metallopeptidase [Tsuneonella sp. HG249]
MTWLLDTLIWTGALIALVLVVRRPVACHFGPQAAYALWALPLMRLLLPPITLPASLAPAAASSADATLTLVLAEAEMPPVQVPAETTSFWPEMSTMVVAVWLAGALVYIGLRLAAYSRLRGELLRDGCTVGTVRGVRLIETPSIQSPLAFGVVDKVVALPPGFMAQTDRCSRDLALAHELAHHRAHDLAANFAALPLFALHWFNPLSWLGWNAMRRDQEAACDARVVEGRARTERACYAALIADAVAAPKFALAAPMACPVLGEKSIVHRLRSLTMTDHSIRRRRAGRALVGLAALALPLTASFSYAQSDVPALSEPPVPPVAPSAPEAPDAPPVPQAPLASDAPEAIEIIDVPEPGERGGRSVVVVRDVHRDGGAGGDAGKHKIITRRLVVGDRYGNAIDPDSPEFREKMRVLEERLGKLDKEIERSVVIDEKRIERAVAHAEAAAEQAARFGTRFAFAPEAFDLRCKDKGAGETRTEDGRRVMRFCQTRVMGSALMGLRSARAAIAANDEMSAEIRNEVLEELDREIARLEAKD